MTLLLDTRTLAASERIEAANAALSSTEIPAVFHYGTSEGPVGHRFDYWDLGQGSHVTRIMGSALGITRGPGVGGTKLVLIDYDRLGLPVDLVRRAVPHLKAVRSSTQRDRPGRAALSGRRSEQ
jgi:hypothetical protein